MMAKLERLVFHRHLEGNLGRRSPSRQKRGSRTTPTETGSRTVNCTEEGWRPTETW